MELELPLGDWESGYRIKGSSLKALSKFYQSNLPHTKAPYSLKSWGHPLHSLCSYQGKLKPAHAHWLIRTFTSSGNTILDPLGGVGTVAFEAGILGRKGYTIDISPFPHAVADAKVAPPSLHDAQAGVEKFIRQIHAVKLTEKDLGSTEFGLNAKITDYYHSETLQEILQARRYFNSKRKLSREEIFYRACVLHILHGNRPYALSRNSHPITPFAPTGPFEKKSLEKSLSEKVMRALEEKLPVWFVPGESFFGDFRKADVMLPGPVDVIITSPPFLGLRFDRPNWLRLWFCGWEASDFHVVSKGHLEREQTKSLDVYREFFKIGAGLLNKGAPLLMHVGGSKSYNMIEGLKQHSRGLFTLVSDVGEDVSRIDNHGIVDKGATSKNHILVFQRR